MNICGNLRIIVYPREVRITRWIDALVAHNMNVQLFGNFSNRLMQMGCKRMASIDNELDVMLTTERQHRFCVKSPVDTLPMMKRDVLFTSLRAIEIR